MIQKPQSTALYQQNILDALVQTGIRQTSPGGKARAFCDIVGDQLGSLEARQFVNLSQTLLPYAGADSLDFLGALYGVSRIQQFDITSSASEGNFEFFVRSGTFGAINNGNPIIVPAGTKIFSGSVGGPVYLVTAAVTLPAGSSSVFFSATNQDGGSQGVAGTGILTQHNFTNYTGSRFSSLLVTNNFGLVGGRDQEDDDSYRYRINLRLQARGDSSEDALRLQLLQVPGVQDLVFVRQSGTFNVYVYGISPSVPPSLLQAVQSQLDSSTAFPLVGTALSPDLIGISLATTLTLSKTVASTDQTSIISSAIAAAEDYINNLGVGGTLVLNQIADKILSADSRIQDIGNPNQPLQSIFIWRSRLDGTRYSRFLVNDYTPSTGERIVVESLATPISLTIAS
jgi:uncharacterized phage protein gp47/JayE